MSRAVGPTARVPSPAPVSRTSLAAGSGHGERSAVWRRRKSIELGLVPLRHAQQPARLRVPEPDSTARVTRTERETLRCECHRFNLRIHFHLPE